MILLPDSCTMFQTSVHSFSGTLSDLIPWIYLSFPLYNCKGFYFNSVAQSCPTLCDPMDCNTPGLPVQCQLLEFTQTHVHWGSDAIQSSHSMLSPSPPTFCLSQPSGSFQMSRLFASGGWSIRASASVSVLLVNIQDWFPLGLTGLMSLQSKGL